MKKEDHISKRLKLPPCPIGKKGFCCKICLMGPCRVTKDIKGVCGASLNLIVARNILRFIAGGTAAHSGHAFHLLKFLNQNYPTNYIKTKAPDYLYKLWDKLNIIPKIKYEHFKDISESLHLSTMGVNADYKDILKWCMKLGIVDGYYGMYLSTELEDKKFGKPKIRQAKINLGVINPNKVNIAVHGHEPMLAQTLAKEAKKHKDINLIGVCCTGASLLSKQGIPLAAHFLLQENVISTGLVEAMVVDVQCIMPSVADLCECYHTKLITTNEIGRIPNALHLPIETEEQAKIVSKKIIQIARQNKKKRTKVQKISKQENKVTIGFSEDNINVKELADKIKNKKIKGIIGVVGCVNPRTNLKEWSNTFKKLSKDYIILTTGCIAFELGKNNLLDGKRFFHLGSCVNNSRIAEIFIRISKLLNKQLTELPFLISCPAPKSEKSIAIGFFFASLGVDVHFGYPFLISSDTNVSKFLENTLKKHFKSKIFLDENQNSFYNKINKGLTIKP